MNILFLGLCTYIKNKDTGELNIIRGGIEQVNNSLLLAMKDEGYTVDYLVQTGYSSYYPKYKKMYNLNSCLKYSLDKVLDNYDKYDIIMISTMINNNADYQLIQSLVNDSKDNPKFPRVIILCHGFNVNNYKNEFVIRSFHNPHFTYVAWYLKEYEYLSAQSNNIINLNYPLNLSEEYINKSIDYYHNRVVPSEVSAVCLARIDPQKGIDNCVKLSHDLNGSLDIFGRKQVSQYYNKIIDEYDPNIYKYSFKGLLGRTKLLNRLHNYSIAMHLPKSMEGGSFATYELLVSGLLLVTWKEFFQFNRELSNVVLISKNEYEKNGSQFTQDMINEVIYKYKEFYSTKSTVIEDDIRYIATELGFDKFKKDLNSMIRMEVIN